MKESPASEYKREVSELFTGFSEAESQYIVSSWRNLLPHLITKFHDGYIASNLNGTSIHMVKLFYPHWWLDAVGYFKNRPNHGDDTIQFMPNPETLGINNSSFFTFFLIIITSIVSFYCGNYYANKNMKLNYNNIPESQPMINNNFQNSYQNGGKVSIETRRFGFDL